MAQQEDLPSILVKSHTAATDSLFKLTSVDTWFSDINIHCTANDSLYGGLDIETRSGTLYVNDVISYRDINLKDLYFANATGGSNTVITAVGTVMTKKQKLDKGIRVD